MLWLAVPLAALAGSATEVASRPGANLERPNWSPDGRQLSWEANYHEKKTVETWVGDPTTRAFTQVVVGARASTLTAGFQTAAPAGRVVHELAWSPPAFGRYVFTASNASEDYELYLTGGSAITASPGADGGAAWSPDGKYVAFTSARTGQGDLYLAAVDAIEQPPRRLTALPTSSELFATWSADAAQVAFVAHGHAGDNLWVVPVTGGAPRQLTSWAGNQIRPTFSPKGAVLAFYANHEDAARWDLYALDLAGGEPRLLVRGVVPDAAGPAWTPDGARLALVLDDDPRFDPIATVAVADGRVTPLALDTVGHGDLDVAARADGTVWLAYTAQGRTTDANRGFQRLYLAPLP